ncbi:MAG: hypothetical protein GY765_22240 [bacterium]|nr:hypothetical protein [bacterium]
MKKTKIGIALAASLMLALFLTGTLLGAKKTNPTLTGGSDACTSAIECGETLSGEWTADCASLNSDGSYAKFYEFTAVEPTTVDIYLESSLDTYLYLLDDGGTILASNNDFGIYGDSKIIYTLNAAGTYTIEATTFAPGRTGDFTLSLGCHDSADCINTMNCGETISGSWSEGCYSRINYGSRAKSYQFTGIGGQTVKIEIDSTTSTYLYLLDPEGNWLASGGYVDVENMNILYLLPESGTYTIEAVAVSAGTTENFSLSLACFTAECTFPISCGDSINGSWTASCPSLNQPGRYAKFYEFSAAADTPVIIDLEASSDTYLYLLDANGTTLASDNDGGTGLNSRITYSPPSDGTYTIEATTYSPGITGDFTLSLDCRLPQLALSRSYIGFGSVDSTTSTETFMVTNSGGGDLNWSASCDQAWLSCSPSSGSGAQEVTVSVDSAGLEPGTHTGTISISAPGAANSPQTVSVQLTIYGTGQSSSPFGEYLTPVDGSTVAGSVPFTGWVLDDVGVESVRIYCDNQYIGEASLVKGARPDIEAAYPTYPGSDRAGWGYMMLTNFLPGGGNGPYTISAIATDAEGNLTTLGSKTITVDNVNAVKPFGSIDTPGQGGTAYGRSYRNQGWVLTPLPNTVPTDGSTIDVYVDSQNLGSPTYNGYREDIASYFPDNTNSSGAGAYLDIDTTNFANGVHTIYWVATDNAGNSDGIGSRFFTIRNDLYESRSPGLKSKSALSGNIPVNTVQPLKKVGFDKHMSFTPPARPQDKAYVVDLREMERVELKFDGAGIVSGHMRAGGKEVPLPIGSSLKDGRFAWIPPVGFSGDYRLIFLLKNQDESLSRSTILLRILPKFSAGE